MNDSITLMDGEEILTESNRHVIEKLQSGYHELFTSIEYVVTSERVIRYVDGLRKTSTDEYPIRDIDQLRTEAENYMDWFDAGTVTFSAGGGGEIVRFENITNYNAFANAIRERQRDIASDHTNNDEESTDE